MPSSVRLFPPHHRGSPGRVRIIGGTHRGRLVAVPELPGLRPTPDRVRETLFNWLGQDLAGASTFDAYAGTGVLTLEARSRGAVLTVAVDRDPRCIRALAGAATKLGLEPVEVRVGDGLACLAAEIRHFDVVFADPPFATDPWAELLPIAASKLVRGGRIYAEAAHPIDAPAPLCVVKRARAGGVHYHLLASADS